MRDTVLDILAEVFLASIPVICEAVAVVGFIGMIGLLIILQATPGPA